VRNISLVRKIKKDPSLKDPLNNELVQHNELIAWRASFFSVIGFIDVAAVVSIFVHINDLMLIFLAALLIGFGTHNATFMFWKGNMMVEKILNNTLKVQKAWKGLTQEQLAELVGVTRKRITTVENRKIIPST
jgi:predicted XRE-type DNA-binding protein